MTHIEMQMLERDRVVRRDDGASDARPSRLTPEAMARIQRIVDLMKRTDQTSTNAGAAAPDPH